MLHFKVSSYLYISLSVDDQDSHLGLLQFSVLVIYCLKPSSFHFFFSFLLSSLPSQLSTIRCQEALTLLLATGGPSVIVPCVRITHSSAVRPSND